MRGVVLALAVFALTQGTYWLGYLIGSQAHAASPCLHGESSTAGRLRDGRFVVTAPPHLTGCAP